jgi:hypothetical protein
LWQEIVKFYKLNLYVINIALKFIVLLWDILRYLKTWEKGGPQYVVSAIFLVKINKGKIGTANPQFFDSVRRIDS